MPGSYIVNLCALPSPQLPPQTLTPEFKSLRFFVSRRRVAGGERFYLHVGFFPTLAQSEHWRDLFLSSYPNAFVSQLSSTPSAPMPDPAVLSETQTLRVLEVRAPRRDGPRDEQAESGFYTMPPEARLQPSQVQSPITTRASPLSDSALATTTGTARTGQTTGNSRDLAEALRDLAAKPDRPEHSDLSSTTGVRHLRIEFVRKSKRPPKTSATQRRT